MGWRSGGILVLLLACLTVTGCVDKPRPAADRPLVMTSLFPLYDFTRAIVGERMEVRLLVPPGSEPHHFEPRPDDIAQLTKAALLVYSGPDMEPWVERIRSNPDLARLVTVQASRGVAMMQVAGTGGHEHDGQRHNGHRVDPHVWLDFGNAARMVDTIVSAVTERDPAFAAGYRANGDALKVRLQELDQRYRTGLADCRSRTLLHGGHYAFGYLAQRYGLQYRAAVGVSAEAEPSPRQLARLVQEIRGSGLQAVFSEELLSPRLAQTLAAETGAQVLQLHGAHTVTRSQLAEGISFIGLMDRNLENLRKGLGCKPY